jgi:nitrogen fixation-related uncharacterized protein
VVAVVVMMVAVVVVMMMVVVDSGDIQNNDGEAKTILDSQEWVLRS